MKTSLLKQDFNSEHKETYHITVLFLASMAKLKGDKSGWSFATNTNNEKQDVKKLFWPRMKPARAFYIKLLL